MRISLLTGGALALLLAAHVATAQPRGAEAILEQAEVLQKTDPAGARQLVDRVLAMPGLSPALRARALVGKCWWSEDSTTSLSAAEAGLVEAGRASDARRVVELLACRGNAYENAGALDRALADYRASRVAAERLGDRKLVADSLTQSGFLLYQRGDLNEALVDLQRSYEISRELKHDEGRRTALAYIAHIYADSKVAQYDKAIEYYRQLLPEYEAAGAQTSVSDTLYNLGSTFERKRDYGSALLWYHRALAAEEKLRRPSEAAYVKRSIGMTLVKLDRPSEALRWFDEALRQYGKTKDVERTMQVRQSRGIALRKLGRLDAAIADLDASAHYFQAANNTRFLEKSEDELAQAYAAAGRWEEAFRARTAHAALQQQLAEKLREEHTSRLRVQFDAEKKEQENRALVRENALRARALEAAARIHRLQTIILILGGAIIVVLAYLVIRHIRDARRMRTMAMTDELTRLPNRRHVLGIGEALLHHTRTGSEPFTFIAFDIDHFKRINDTFGHAAGDAVLQRIARACRQSLRPGDHIGRTGGEEFAVLLPQTSLHEAVQVAERLRTAVEAVDYSDLEPGLHVTISLGVAEWSPADTTLARIAGRADELLYRAKAGGRNRVERVA
ncbi:MAG: hypothetical protein JWM24_1774 [Solirubrobacterales bacterium]|nr:hypothetical protein [Solirubrobacterales bacterium]